MTASNPSNCFSVNVIFPLKEGSTYSKYFARNGNRFLSFDDCFTSTECPEIKTDKKS